MSPIFILLAFVFLILSLFFSIIAFIKSTNQEGTAVELQRKIDQILNQNKQQELHFEKNEHAKNSDSPEAANAKPQNIKNHQDSAQTSATPEIPEIVTAQAVPVFQDKENIESTKKIFKKPKKSSYENFIGKNLFGIAASVLIFIGLIFLGVLVYGNINDTIKVVLMYFISFAITGLGIFLFIKKDNIFTKSLTGCGAGCLFISVLITHVHFNLFNDITAFSLLLVWLIAVLFLSQKLNSLLLNIIAHAGMIISICFAYSLGLPDGKLITLLIYQFACVIIIILGNMLYFKKMFRFGLFASFGLTITASLFMIANFYRPFGAGTTPFFTTLPTLAVTVAFALQFICTSFISYILSVSTGHLKDGKTKTAIHIINKLLWTLSFALTGIYVIHSLVCFENASAGYSSVLITSLICLCILLLHIIITTFMDLKLNFDSLLGIISTTILSLSSVVILFLLWRQKVYMFNATPNIPYFILIAGVLLALRYITKSKAYSAIAVGILGLDFLFMAFGGYRELQEVGTIALPLFYMLLYPGILLAQWLMANDEAKNKMLPYFKISLLLLIEFSIIPIFTDANINNSFEIMRIVLTALLVVFSFVKYGDTPIATSLIKANSAIILLLDVHAIAFTWRRTSTESLLLNLLSFVAFALLFIRINKLLDKSNSTVDGLFFGIGFSLLVLATINGNSNMFDQTYIFSLICMLASLVCVIIGLYGRNKALRLFGLSITMACVLKLMTFDVAGLETPLRVLSLIGGGIICFIISAIYNYTVKHLSPE